jgi:hypothetical protein
VADDKVVLHLALLAHELASSAGTVESRVTTDEEA